LAPNAIPYSRYSKEGKKRNKGERMTYPVVCFEVINLLPKYQHPEIFTEKFYNVEGICEARTVFGESLKEEISLRIDNRKSKLEVRGTEKRLVREEWFEEIISLEICLPISLPGKAWTLPQHSLVPPHGLRRAQPFYILIRLQLHATATTF
jgi:hypothetical protein